MTGLTPPSFDVSLPAVNGPAVAASPPGSSFASVLDEAGRGTGRQEARAAADQLVATAFVLPLLEQARNSPFKSELFDGGRAEAAFGQQLDVIFAENITRAANFGLGDAIAERLGSGTEEIDSVTGNQIDLYG